LGGQASSGLLLEEGDWHADIRPSDRWLFESDSGGDAEHAGHNFLPESADARMDPRHRAPTVHVKSELDGSLSTRLTRLTLKNALVALPEPRSHFGYDLCRIGDGSSAKGSVGIVILRVALGQRPSGAGRF
jgi:hypothetical protein